MTGAGERVPQSTVAHFWPGTPARLVVEARERGIVTVREMINSACATLGPGGPSPTTSPGWSPRSGPRASGPHRPASAPRPSAATGSSWTTSCSTVRRGRCTSSTPPSPAATCALEIAAHLVGSLNES